MKVIYGIGKIENRLRRPVVTIGIFDGVHLGHRFIIKQLIKKAKQIDGSSIVLTFDPHPRNILRPKNYLPLLISIKHRMKMLRSLGVDVCIVEEFSRCFYKLSPEEFVGRLLVKKIHPQQLFVGSGFTFGKDASGDIELLKKMSRLYNFNVKEILPVKIGKEIISSTSIRKLIQKGHLKQASRFLGRSVSVFGKVMTGKKEGRILGYPTANIYPCGEITPPVGVYATRVGFDKKRFFSMAFLESKVHSNKQIQIKRSNIEVHIFNFDKKIYGRYIEIEFLKKIRNIKKFSSPEELKKQIEKDEKAVKLFLKTYRKK